ncbi:MAG: lipid IV(A) 3-deoxy-D-manno-octulosonic acid transferase [Gammaproteobacteria bacterium]
MRFLYVLLSYLLTPVVLGFLLWRGARNRAYLERLPERFGFGQHMTQQPCVWVHAVSVGEIQAASALVRRILHDFPTLPVTVTTTTPTGAQRAWDLFGDQVQHRFAPYDLPGSVARFFDRVVPKVAIIIETELWPNLYNECGRRGVPLILASARISPLSVGKYRRFVSLFREALSHGIVIGAQSESDAERFRSLGANPARTFTTGNIKFDFELPLGTREKGLVLRETHGANRPVWIAASTHDDEEALVLDAFETILESAPDALLILVPRHPERFRGVGQLLAERGFNYVARTSNKTCDASTSVWLIDTLGELQAIYGAADVAFVGGSLVPVGGHNLLEPAALGVAVVTGKHLYNTEDIADMLVREGGVRVVEDSAELAQVVTHLLSEKDARETMSRAAEQIIETNRGAVDRLLELISPILTPHAQDDGAAPDEPVLKI